MTMNRNTESIRKTKEIYLASSKLIYKMLIYFLCENNNQNKIIIEGKGLYTIVIKKKRWTGWKQTRNMHDLYEDKIFKIFIEVINEVLSNWTFLYWKMQYSKSLNSHKIHL